MGCQVGHDCAGVQAKGQQLGPQLLSQGDSHQHVGSLGLPIGKPFIVGLSVLQRRCYSLVSWQKMDACTTSVRGLVF